MLNQITPEHIWEPTLSALRDLAGSDSEVTVKRRALVSELNQSHGVDISGNPDEHANDYLNKTIFLLRSAGLIKTVARGEYRLTETGLTSGLPLDTDFGTFEVETDEESQYLKPLWHGDDYIISLVAKSAPCYGRYSPESEQCTHQCAVSGACHTATIAVLTRAIDKCPADAPTLVPPETENVLRKMPIRKEKKCGLSGKTMNPGDEVYFHDEYGLISEEAAKEFAADNPGWSVE